MLTCANVQSLTSTCNQTHDQTVSSRLVSSYCMSSFFRIPVYSFVGLNDWSLTNGGVYTVNAYGYMLKIKRSCKLFRPIRLDVFMYLMYVWFCVCHFWDIDLRINILFKGFASRQIYPSRNGSSGNDLYTACEFWWRYVTLVLINLYKLLLDRWASVYITWINKSNKK